MDSIGSEYLKLIIYVGVCIGAGCVIALGLLSWLIYALIQYWR